MTKSSIAVAFQSYVFTKTLIGAIGPNTSPRISIQYTLPSSPVCSSSSSTFLRMSAMRASLIASTRRASAYDWEAVNLGLSSADVSSSDLPLDERELIKFSYLAALYRSSTPSQTARNRKLHLHHWRADVRADALFSEVRCFLSRFMHPFIELLRYTAGLPIPFLAPSQSANGQTLVVRLTMVLEA